MDQYIILLVDRKHGHFYRYAGSKLSPLREVTHEDIPKSVKSASWAGLADDRVARHVEEHVNDHYRSLIRLLETYLDDKEASDAEIIIGGPEAELATFVELLPHVVKERVVAQVHPDHYVGIKELEEQIEQAISEVTAAKAVELLEIIENERQPEGKGAVGREAVYEALNLKEVQTLLVDEHAEWSGTVCPQDGSVSASNEKCPICLGVMEPAADFRLSLDSLAGQQGAEIIALPHSVTLPDEYEHVAALKRFTH